MLFLRRPRVNGIGALLYSDKSVTPYVLRFDVPVHRIDPRLFHQAALAMLFPSKVPSQFSGAWTEMLSGLQGEANAKLFGSAAAAWFTKLFSSMVSFEALTLPYQGKLLSQAVALNPEERAILCEAVQCLFWGINNLQSSELQRFPHTTATAHLANAVFGLQAGASRAAGTEEQSAGELL